MLALARTYREVSMSDAERFVEHWTEIWNELDPVEFARRISETLDAYQPPQNYAGRGRRVR
jgi:hypothetical protein